MKIEFAPLNIPLERRLQTAAVLQWVLSLLLLEFLKMEAGVALALSLHLYSQCRKLRFPTAVTLLLSIASGYEIQGADADAPAPPSFSFLAGEIGIGILVMLIVHNYWFIYIPYLAWFFYDWETPERGGRRSDWVRSWTVWKYFKDYFPIHLIKTQDLDPSHNYIFGFHPHGTFATGAFGNFCTNYSDFKKLFPGFTVYLHMVTILLRLPFFREYLMTSVGRPIPVQQTLHPTPEQIEELHRTYLQELRTLFEEHKGKYGIPEHKTLVFT
ncbi:2-acylglycerol O-acyltransferase 1-like [Acomys russatus]|uniref:2-acylglycerol O-acyltransferase 1-like n=1 Tax=Acomys russatus TaxID=60746 RepID=UPI0021E2B169|nr:2-acylglycerol O-acyltransferase 1-like [Acomys russatus]